MINRIIDAMSININAEFGDSYEIYTEDIEQGLEEPCFSIMSLNPTNDLFIQNRYSNRHLMCIQYFPSSDEPKSEMNDVYERLTYCLEYITLVNPDDSEDLTRGSNMNAEITNGVLSFFVNFDMFTERERITEDPMEDLEINSYAGE